MNNIYLNKLMLFFVKKLMARARMSTRWILLIVFNMISFIIVYAANAEKFGLETYFSKPIPCKLTNYAQQEDKKIDGCNKSTCIDIKDNYRVCKCVTEEDKDTGFLLYHDNKQIGRWYANAFMGNDSDYEVLTYDLDLNGNDELIVANLIGTSNGMVVNHWEIFVLQMTNTYLPPLQFGVEDYGVGSFIMLPNSNTCGILATEWGSARNSLGKVGEYFIGRIFKYNDGALAPIADAPIFSRRLLDSFEKERNNSLTSDAKGFPLTWLNNSKTEERSVDPFFDLLSTVPVENIEAIAVNVTMENDTKPDLPPILHLELMLDSGKRAVYMFYPGQNGIDRIGSKKDKKLYPLGYYPEGIMNKLINKKVNIYKYIDEYKQYYNVLWVE